MGRRYLGSSAPQFDGFPRVRRFRESDAPRLTAIYRAAVQERAKDDYSAQQIAAWLSVIPSAQDFAVKYGDGRLALVAEDGAGQAVGFTDLEKDGHIDFLYLHPDWAGQGLAARLIATLESEARCHGLPRIFAEASETALPFFLRQGFRCLARRELRLGAVEIHNYSVEKRLVHGWSNRLRACFRRGRNEGSTS